LEQDHEQKGQKKRPFAQTGKTKKEDKDEKEERALIEGRTMASQEKLFHH